MTQFSFVDTHTHLDDAQFDPDRDQVIDAAIAVGVRQFVNIGYRPIVWESTLRLADLRREVRYVLGLHPGHADEWSEQLLDDLRALVTDRDPVAIGEIGLDYYWSDENKSIQRTSFERQIELALEQNLPIVVHQRSAAADVHAILTNAPGDLRVVLHSFDGDPALADLAEERDWYLGVGGLATRRQSEQLKSRLQLFPLDQILLETDSPYLVPAGLKERRNVPANVALIAERLAGLLGVTVAEVARQTTANAELALGLGAGVAGSG